MSSSDSKWLHSDFSSVWHYYDKTLRSLAEARVELQTDYDETEDSIEESADNLLYSKDDELAGDEEYYEDEYEEEFEENYEKEEMDTGGHVLGNEEDWTPEMAEFVRKTREHREELAKAKARKETEKPKQTIKWIEKEISEFVMAEEVGLYGVQKASTSAPTHNREAEEHKAQMNKLYGSAAEKIGQLEMQANLKFEELYKKSNATLWPNIPLRF